MISQASVNYARIAPRKVRYVIDLIRKKNVNQARAILIGSPRRAGEIVKKLLDQAVDAAVKNSQVDPKSLYVSKVLADGGPSMRRFRAASMGRASVIKKRTSHIIIELDAKGAVPASQAPKAQRGSSTQSAPKTAKKTAVAGKGAKKLVGAK